MNVQEAIKTQRIAVEGYVSVQDFLLVALTD